MNPNTIIIKNKSQLYALQNHDEGELVYCEDDKTIYSWDEEKGWFPITLNNEGLQLNLYDLNKSIINQLDPLNTDTLLEKIDLIYNYFSKTQNNYYMLLCKDYNYYTLFAKNSLENIPFHEAVMMILYELGKIYSIEELEDGAIEVWLKPNEEESPYAFYLFPYDAGVVYYG